MIHDATVEVTCDGQCGESVRVELGYVYGGIGHSQGQYDDDDSKVEQEIEEKHEWIVRDGKHYCSRACARKTGD